jgi:type VI secretion system secreted protein VgrG
MLGLLAAVIIPSGVAAAAEPTVPLFTAATFAVLAGTGITNTGPTFLVGDVGTCPTPATTGFPPGVVVGGTNHGNDAAACAAKADLLASYNDAAGRAPTVSYAVPTDLGGMTLTSGVYMSPSSLALTGTLFLDAGGDPDAAFVFQAGSTVVTASNSHVVLINGAQACNVFWQVGSSATLGTGTTFVGSILALTSITATTNATVEGRLLARNGATTLDTNVVNVPTCAAVVPPTTTTTTAVPTTTTAVLPTTTTTAVLPTTTTTAVLPTTTTTAVLPTTTTTAVLPTTTTTAVLPTTTTTAVLPTTTTTAVLPTTTTTIVLPTTTTTIAALPTTTTTAIALPTTPTSVALTATPGLTTATTERPTPVTTPVTIDLTPRLPETGTNGYRNALVGLAILSLGYATRRTARHAF